MTKRIPQRPGGYARISQDRRGLALGVERQQTNGSAFCAAQGWGPLRWFVDNDISASTNSDKVRPEYINIRRAAETGEIDGFFVYNMDRLTRRMTELVEFLPWIRRIGTPFMTTEGDDTETANGRMVIQIKGAVAQQEAERIAERLELAMRQRKENRLYSAGGFRPWGWYDNTFSDHEDVEKNAYLDGATMILASKSPGDVMRHWQQSKVPTVTGKPWNHLNQVKRLLTSARFAGLMTGVEGTLVPAENILAIVDADTWHKVCAVMSTRGEARGTGYGARKHLYAGFIKCGSCGARMVAQVAPTRARWHCEATAGGCGHVSRNYGNVTRLLNEMMTLALKAHVIEIESEPEENDPAFILQVRLDALQGKIDSTRQNWLAGVLDDEDYYPQLAALREMVNEVKREQAALVTVDNTPKGDEALAIWLDPESTLDQKRAIVESLVHQITIKPVGKTGRRPLDEDSLMVVWR